MLNSIDIFLEIYHFLKQGYEVTPTEGRIYAYDQDIGINATVIYSFLTSSKNKCEEFLFCI
jgi:hypothetical protein